MLVTKAAYKAIYISLQCIYYDPVGKNIGLVGRRLVLTLLASNVIPLCCIFASQGISLCFPAVKIVKASLETRNFFTTDFFVCFSGYLKYRKFFKLGARKVHFLKYKKFSQSGFFYFSSSENSLLKCKKFFRGFHFPKYQKRFLGGKI